MTDTILQALFIIPALIIAIVFHEVAHGLAALALGDQTAKRMKRLSFNPIRHVDMVGTLLVPGALWLMGAPVFGWAKPVPVIKGNLRNPRYGMMLVAAAGPAMNLALAGGGALVLGFALTPAVPQFLHGVLATFIVINIFLALFNLLPIPPFDGSHIAEGFTPARHAHYWHKIRQAGIFVIIVLVAISWTMPQFDPIGAIVGPPVEWLAGYYLSLASQIGETLYF